MSESRRNFLMRVAQAGGYSAVYAAMQCLGLLPVSALASTLPKLPGEFGSGKRVVVLGAGMAGLVAAYELRKAGFSCTVLEALPRPGGRAWTVRQGTKVAFTDGTVQHCEWGAGQYLNAGPGRIASIHTHYLGYAQTLGVRMEVEVNVSRSALMQSNVVNGGKPVRNREVIYDTRGYIAELLAKAINKHSLDTALTREDSERMLDLLKDFGALDAKYAYTGTWHAGYQVRPGAASALGEPRRPLPLHDLLVANFSKGSNSYGEFSEDELNWQATMFEPVGGMDRLPYGFAKALGPVVQFEAPVQEIRKTSTGVRVVYSNLGRPASLEADYCICTLPVSILRTLKTDFSPAYRAAIDSIQMGALYKIAWESPRFWESDDHIYGGNSFLKGNLINLLWYPSGGFLSRSGVLVAGYDLERLDDGSNRLTAFGKLPSVQAKLEASRAAVEVLHPGRSRELRNPIYVSWEKIPYFLGAFANVWLESAHAAYTQLNRPDGRLLFAGDYLTEIAGWQEGAILSAHRAVELISERVRSNRG